MYGIYIDKPTGFFPRTLPKTFDLHQGAATYTIFTPHAQDCLIDSLTWRQTGGVPGGALTSISIQTNDATPAIFISAANGAAGNLVNQAILNWLSNGSKILLKVGKFIQITIAGGAAAAANVNDIVIDYHAAIPGGYLT